MHTKTNKRVGLMLWAACLLPLCALAEYPQKPIRFIMPFPAGGATEIIGRMIGQRLTEVMGQPVVIDNRGGAGGNLGIEIAARAAPDGYTMVLVAPNLTISPSLYRKLNYDPVKDFAPVTLIARVPIVMITNPALPAQNLKEFIALARAKPGSLNYGSAGTGSSTHLATELFRQMANINVVHVPYKGIGPAIIDLLGGQIQFYIAPGAGLLPYTSTGKLRLLAATGEQRSRDLPEVPAVNEVVPGYSAEFWYALGAPAGTPRAIIATLNQEVARVLKQPELQKRLRTFDLEATHSTPEEFARRITREISMWSQVARNAGISIE